MSQKQPFFALRINHTRAKHHQLSEIKSDLVQFGSVKNLSFERIHKKFLGLVIYRIFFHIHLDLSHGLSPFFAFLSVLRGEKKRKDILQPRTLAKNGGTPHSLYRSSKNFSPAGGLFFSGC